MRVDQLKFVLNALEDKALSQHIKSSYKDEIAAGDTSPIELKGVGDVAAIFKAAEGMSGLSRQSLKLDTLDIWTPHYYEAQYPQPVPRQTPTSASPAPTYPHPIRQTTDLDGPQIEAFRYQSLKDTGLLGDLTLNQFRVMQDSPGFQVAIPPSTQQIHLAFTPDDENVIRSCSSGLPEKIIANHIDLAVITQTIAQLATIFSRSHTTQIHEGGLAPGSIAIGGGIKTVFVPIL
jgi:hypothetical protein